MKRFKAAKAAALLLCFALCFALAACSGARRIYKSEIAACLPALVEQSKVLNEIYFGDGFPPRGDAELPGNGYYYADTAVYGLESITAIKEATEKVFTPEYSAVLYAAAFDGVVGEDGAVSLPRYAEGELGLMQHMGAVVYELADRSYDFETLKLKKAGTTRATVSVETSDEHGNAATVELIVVRTVDEAGNATYRLDSPTY